MSLKLLLFASLVPKSQDKKRILEFKTAWGELFAEKVPRRSLKNENWEFEEEVLTVAEINSETVDYTQRNIKLPD